MRWGGLRQSDNVEDRRGMRVGGRGVALSGTGLILLLAIAFITGTNPLELLDQVSGPSVSTEPKTSAQYGTSRSRR